MRRLSQKQLQASATALHGFLTSVVSGPPVLPSEWIPVVFRIDQSEGWETLKQAQRAMTLLMRFYNEVVADLAEESGRYGVLLDRIGDAPDTVDFADDWCTGYLAGVALCEDAWREPMAAPELRAAFAPILALGTLPARAGAARNTSVAAGPCGRHNADRRPRVNRDSAAAIGRISGLLKTFQKRFVAQPPELGGHAIAHARRELQGQVRTPVLGQRIAAFEEAFDKRALFAGEVGRRSVNRFAATLLYFAWRGQACVANYNGAGGEIAEAFVFG